MLVLAPWFFEISEQIDFEQPVIQHSIRTVLSILPLQYFQLHRAAFPGIQKTGRISKFHSRSGDTGVDTL
jgi:hypothetical protein